MVIFGPYLGVCLVLVYCVLMPVCPLLVVPVLGGVYGPIWGLFGGLDIWVETYYRGICNISCILVIFGGWVWVLFWDLYLMYLR